MSNYEYTTSVHMMLPCGVPLISEFYFISCTIKTIKISNNIKFQDVMTNRSLNKDHDYFH